MARPKQSRDFRANTARAMDYGEPPVGRLLQAKTWQVFTTWCSLMV
jgi:hypothetical protein